LAKSILKSLRLFGDKASGLGRVMNATL